MERGAVCNGGGTYEGGPAVLREWGGSAVENRNFTPGFNLLTFRAARRPGRGGHGDLFHPEGDGRGFLRVRGWGERAEDGEEEAGVIFYHGQVSLISDRSGRVSVRGESLCYFPHLWND